MTSNGSYAGEFVRTGGSATSPEPVGIASLAYGAFASAFVECAAFVAGVGYALVRAVKIRRTYLMLAKLDDHMLKDIGIGRLEIDSVAVHSADFPGIPYPRRAS